MAHREWLILCERAVDNEAKLHLVCRRHAAVADALDDCQRVRDAQVPRQEQDHALCRRECRRRPAEVAAVSRTADSGLVRHPAHRVVDTLHAAASFAHGRGAEKRVRQGKGMIQALAV